MGSGKSIFPWSHLLSQCHPYSWPLKIFSCHFIYFNYSFIPLVKIFNWRYILSANVEVYNSPHHCRHCPVLLIPSTLSSGGAKLGTLWPTLPHFSLPWPLASTVELCFCKCDCFQWDHAACALPSHLLNIFQIHPCCYKWGVGKTLLLILTVAAINLLQEREGETEG